MLRTGLGVGRGRADAEKHDACIVASWLLSGGRFGAEYMRENPNGCWLAQALRMDCGVFQDCLKGVEHLDEALAQLRRMNARAVRDAYTRHRKRYPHLPSVWKQGRRAERTRRALDGEILEDSHLLN